MRREIILADLYEKQEQLLHAALDPEIFFVIAVVGRQAGKTLFNENMAVYWAMNDPGSIIFWVSPTDSQAQKNFKSILAAIIESGVINSKKMPKGDTEIVFKNGSKILFRSAASGDNLRGPSVNYMILDEAAFMKQDTVEDILFPMLGVLGKKVLIGTTPKGKNNWVYDYFKRGQTDNKDYKSFRWSSYESPYFTKKLENIFRDSFSPVRFRQEIEAEFIDQAGVFHNIPELLILEKQLEPIPGEEYYCGIDIGLITDASVMTILNKAGDLVTYYRWTHIEADELMRNIETTYKKWNITKGLIENNNQGLVIWQQLKHKLPNLQEFNTNSKTKAEIINNLILQFNTKAFKLCDDQLLRIELEAFIFKQNDTGYIKFQADYGFSDDIVMALAIGKWAVKKQFNPLYYNVF